MPENTLDIEQPDALIAYLRQSGHIQPDEQPVVRTLAGGVSNRTVYVKRSSGEAWVIKQALEKLRVKVDWFSSTERIHREAEGLRWLSTLAPAGSIVPFVFEDRDYHLLGMQAVSEPYDNWKTLLLKGDLQADHVRQFADILGTVERNAYQQRDKLADAFADRSFFESLRLEPYYSYTATQVPQAADFLNALIENTRQRRITLVHGDYSPKNILVHQNRLILLDHEVIHWGDPAFDLGFSMTHLLSKAHHLPSQRADFASAVNAYWQQYTTHVRDLPWFSDLEPFAVQHTLACLLARVEGRSPLEYFNADEQNRQRTAVLSLLSNIPNTVSELVQRFIEGL